MWAQLLVQLSESTLGSLDISSTWCTSLPTVASDLGTTGSTGQASVQTSAHLSVSLSVQHWARLLVQLSERRLEMLSVQCWVRLLVQLSVQLSDTGSEKETGHL
jgi:hypothetical protein